MGSSECGGFQDMTDKKVKLGDVCLKIGSGATPKGGATVYLDKGTTLVRSQNVYNLQFDYAGLVWISEEAAKKLNSATIYKNDVLLNITGDSVARTCMVPDRIIPARVNQHVCIIRPDACILNPYFLNYYLASPYMQSYMLGLAVGKGASRNAMTKSMIANFDIPCPDLTVQKKIVGILSAYDNLIENNQKQIKLLEEAAQRLYKEWFVDLHFPGYENTKIIDGIPEGWERKLIETVIKKVPRTKQIKTSDYLMRGVIPIIDQSRDFIAGYTNDNESLVDIGVPVIVFGDHTRILKYIQFPFAKGADGTQLIVSNNENMPQPLLYCSLVNIDLSDYHYARHFKYLKAEEILLPSRKVAKMFSDFASVLFAKQQNCRTIIINAQQARNRLLPKLMSGELEV